MVSVTMKPDGRVLVPAGLRREFGADPDETLVARVEDGRLVIERQADVIRRLQDRFAHVSTEVSLVDELLEERRAEVRREG